MKSNRIALFLLFCTVVFFNVFLLSEIEVRVRQINCFSYETAFRNFRDHAVPGEVAETFRSASDSDMKRYSELLTMYFATDNIVSDVDLLTSDIALVRKYRSEEFEEICGYVYAVWNDLEQFPVGKIADNPDATISFADSWMQSRTFGGERGHEGCDLMATVNQRGIYPIYSMTDGVVENIGWLRLGGYRIGIRSESGAYFYYAHLADYAEEFVQGDKVKAGTLLGFMGDTGYSDIPGTTGNFDVHLHLGIYLNDRNGQEFSVNSYPMLCYLYGQEPSS
ncbi:MAG: M23 family metallopeptidase [Roseburia sp.]|nr:M23 family metallopeptidase [Roseburia sp.]